MRNLGLWILMCIAFALPLTGCGRKDDDGSSGGSVKQGEEDAERRRRPKPAPEQDEQGNVAKEGDQDEEQTEQDPDDLPISEVTTSVGVRNFDQLNFTLSSLTGVPTTNANVRAEFLAVKSALPDNNEIKEVTPAKVSALTKLAARYCDEMVLNTNLRSQVLPGFNFTATPSVAFADADSLASMLIERFWGAGLDGLPDPQGDIEILSQLIADMAAGKPNTAQTTQAVVMGACTAVLSAAPIMVF